MALKYKVGDRVRIKSIDWYNENKDEVGNIRYKRDGSAYPVFFSKYMSNFCGEILTIKSVFKHSYHMNETSSCEFWTDEMIEGLVEENISLKLTGKAIKNNEMVVSVSEYILPEGYIIKDENGIVINTNKIVLEKKSPKTDDIIKWLRECDMTKYIGVIYSGMCSITFDTEGLIKDFLKTVEDDE